VSRAFDARYEVRNAIGESLRDGAIVVVAASTEDELHDLETEAARAADEEGGGRSASGHWYGAPGNGWRIRVETNQP
jgi:hypothetical protein